MTDSHEARIQRLQVQLQQAKAAKRQADARARAAAAKQERAADTRRKVLIGALMMDIMRDDPQTREGIMQRLATYLTRDTDRAMFGLPPLPPPPVTQGQPAPQ